jgi:ABC-type Fe3+/spermidine/putrescine transport system ATPase subunit
VETVTVLETGEKTASGRAVSVRGLSKEYTGTNARAVDDISFDVDEGELLVLLGPSGCGKTTTLRMVAGLEEPDDGEVWFGSALVSSAARNMFMPIEKRNIGMVFQSYAIWPHMSVFENVAYPLRVRRVSKRLIEERVQKALAVVGLEGLERRQATHLSGGQQQRVALARAIVFEPRILLLDEPLSNLDAKLRVHMRGELKSVQAATGITTIFVTHDQSESMALADRIVVMNRGRIEQVGTPADVYERPRTRFVNEFVGSINVLPGVVTAIEGTRVSMVSGGYDIEGHLAADLRLAPGDRVSATIRPERLVILPEQSTPATNRWPAQVAAAAYYGDHREYELDIGERLVKVNAPPNVDFGKGERVVVSCDPTEVVVSADTLP